ncbi:FHS family L-fucose permease-like MFS transporter [Pontibacter ummariensis]|uniref:MFS transporter, FHS family, L-fucose permease n=1 Tax=Pontibacter ummariensis TaxID=1610492 RepID=A0A239G725_9BACT|nr:L-fucose:H+ symporter permease [Pontibacter ummariensis]PRY11634.1 FHS family L-fucose permease-like MFS transporter [Pontibacter ummariensis]SNS64243.1 MFS transporter, FHS family, L-fucose permease [Pontibacter ummariensis]
MAADTTKRTLIRSGNIWPFLLITSLFFLWGLANNMTDTLLAAFKRIMSMSDFQTSWIQMAFYGAYFCLALPAAILIKKYTYKTGILVGLGLFILGSLLFYPASMTMAYGHFLMALYVLAGGLSILETAANPYIIAMGPEETGTRRLNLAQSFNPIGSITGVLLSKLFILSQLNLSSAEERAAMSQEQLAAIQSDELTAVMGPYVGVALFLVLIWLAVKFTDMPKASDGNENLDLLPTFKRLVRTPHYVWAVIAQFFYVGAQICVWSYTIRYVMQEIRLNEEDASSYYMAALMLFMVSRFIFTALMKYVSPRKLLLISAVAASACTLVVIYGSGYVGAYALIAISGCMSLMFPTIYGMGIRGLGDDTKIGGSGLIMAILGGAVITSVQGYVSDLTQDISLAFYVPLVCFVVVALYAVLSGRLERRNPHELGDQAEALPSGALQGAG